MVVVHLCLAVGQCGGSALGVVMAHLSMAFHLN